MNNKQERQRLNALFTELERLAADPDSHTQEISQQLEALRARMVELEKKFLEDEINASAQDDKLVDGSTNRPAATIIYEKDQIGYGYSNDKLEALQGSMHTLPNLNDVTTSLLTIGGQTIGEMQIEPEPERPLTQSDMELVNVITQQASLQIQNLRLLAAAERSRTEAETATRRFMHESWDSYLDAINQSERIGYAYNQASVTPYTDKLHVNGGVHESVNVMDEEVGSLYLKPDPNRPLTDADKELVSAVANQVAQQVENIRLLADASRARSEAEEAIRRLTRENWKSFTTDKDESNLGFVYDSVQVTPMGESTPPQDIVLTQPLIVRGEAVGQLAVAGWKNVPAEAISLAASIAAQASIHLETLRLSEELQKRAKELEELDRLKSAFLANMSHELRTPLNSILGFTDVMLEGLDGDLTDYMDNDLRLIQKNGQHLLHLINDVLDMAKIESGRMNLHPEKFKVHSVLDEVTSITSTLASEKNLALFIDEDSDQEVEIFADNTRLRQVMINLVNNSIKFTEKGKIALRVAPMDGARVLITVRDTGIGIPPDKLEAVFQEFTQVDTSTTRKVGGTGLGLPISRKLVEMHGGRIWVESTGVNGEGSTFFVELPLEARITEVVEKQEK
ncbi:MAG: ATP-binding protein [Anaerolineae bacterium]|nr:ATP-binding protein [Anaerolineae bacterium]MCI0611002.1 ATP-binding protein [Anaerolineae bacterium]